MCATSQTPDNPTLAQLLSSAWVSPVRLDHPALKMVVVRLVQDSRDACRGDVYIGRAEFAADALSRGAAVVVTDQILEGPTHQIVQIAPVPYMAWRLSKAYFQVRERKGNLIGVTGTNGKTTVAYGVRHLLGESCSLLSTVQWIAGEVVTEATQTTPGALTIASHVDRALASGQPDTVLEISSHALDQGRIDPSDLCCAIFTNISQDHLDYHGTMEHYTQAKLRMFEELSIEGLAVINADDAVASRVQGAVQGGRMIRYAMHTNAEVRGRVTEMTMAGMTLQVTLPSTTIEIRSPLVGEFNAYNVLALVAFGYGMGLEVNEIVERLSTFSGAPGRCQRVESQSPATVLVDYAHTPDALANVLRTFRPLAPGQLWVVCGCGGDRDTTKRALMAQACAEHANQLVFTSDNPRSESPDGILDAMVAGLKSTQSYHRNADRKLAIEHALRHAAAEDTVIVAGKGHETYQEIQGERIDFSDVAVIEGYTHA